MKQFKNLTIISFVFLMVFSFASCSETAETNSNTKTEAAATQPEIEDKEHNSKYICPMYCEGSGSDHAGDCPVCHMHYVENEEYQAPK